MPGLLARVPTFVATGVFAAASVAVHAQTPIESSSEVRFQLDRPVIILCSRARKGARRASPALVEADLEVGLSTRPERYRSGRNGGASKASCPVRGTWVRIPPSPPDFARASRELRLGQALRAGHHHRPPYEGLDREPQSDDHHRNWSTSFPREDRGRDVPVSNTLPVDTVQ